MLAESFATGDVDKDPGYTVNGALAFSEFIPIGTSLVIHKLEYRYTRSVPCSPKPSSFPLSLPCTVYIPISSDMRSVEKRRSNGQI